MILEELDKVCKQGHIRCSKCPSAGEEVIAELVDTDGNMVPELKAIISQWFLKYSVVYTKSEIVMDVCKKAIDSGKFTKDEVRKIPGEMRLLNRQNCARLVEWVTSLSTDPSAPIVG